MFSAILIAFQILLLDKFKNNNIRSNNDKYSAMDQIRLYINQNRIGNKSNSIFCNNVDFVKYFLGNDLYVLKPNAYSLFTGSFKFNEIFHETYSIVSPKAVIPLLKEFKIQWFVLDTNYISEGEILTPDDSISLKKELEINIFILFRVCSKT